MPFVRNYVDLFSFNHKCKYKYFNESLKLKEYICKPCNKKKDDELIEMFNKTKKNKKIV